MKLKDLIPQSIQPEGEADALALLRTDHDEVEELFRMFDEIKYGRAHSDKRRLVDEVCARLRMHVAIEEEIFYPALRAEIADDDLMNEALVEHEGVVRLVGELEQMDPGDEMLNAKMHVLCTYVRHHVREEEQDMFPKVGDIDIDLVALGKRLKKRKLQLSGTAPAGKAGGRAAKPGPGEPPAEPRAGR